MNTLNLKGKIMLLSSSDDKKLKLWEEITQTKILFDESDKLETLLFTKDNKYLLSGSWD
jgi:hypothetical protein